MKTMMKKTAACLLAMLLVFQMLPAFADTITSYEQGPIESLRDKLEITTETYKLLVGTTIQLKATAGYKKLKWESSNEKIATVSKNGEVEGIAPGTVKITATEGIYSDSVTLEVIQLKSTEEGKEKEDRDEEEPLVIIVNASKDKLTYDGQEHVSGFTAVSSSDEFDADKVKMIRPEHLVTAKDCGTYKTAYKESDFVYEGDEKAQFVISNGWIQIKPASVTVKANDATQKGDEKPEFTATVTGLIEGDDPSMIQYTFEVYTAGNVTYINPVCEQVQGNYRVTTEPGILIIENGVYRAIKLTSDWPAGQPAYVGTKITMTAELIGFEDVKYTLQWQHSVDRKEWVNEPGANGTTFTFELNETTVQYTWRVVANY